MAPLVSIPAEALPATLVAAAGPLLPTSVTSFLPQPQPPWAPTKQPVQLNTGTGATIGGALYAGRGPRSAALAEPAATSAPVATEPSRIFFIRAPVQVGCTAAVCPQGAAGYNRQTGFSGGAAVDFQ